MPIMLPFLPSDGASEMQQNHRRGTCTSDLKILFFITKKWPFFSISIEKIVIVTSMNDVIFPLKIAALANDDFRFFFQLQ